MLGEHKILCGDATKTEDYKALLGDELADMTVTDPPYNVNYANTAKDKMRGTNRPILNDNMGDLTPCAKLVKPLQSIHGAAHIAEPLAPPARALQWLMGDAACTAANQLADLPRTGNGQGRRRRIGKR